MFVVYAHRGASEYAPENTFSSFYMGIQMGANGIETDVRKTKDGVLVLFHDKNLERVIGCEGTINDYTYAELMQMKVKNDMTDTSDVIVTLEDFLRYIGCRDLHFAIELKEDLGPEVVEMLEKYNMQDKAIITCFRLDFLKRVKDIRPNWPVGHLTKEVTDALLDEMKAMGVEQLCPGCIYINGPEDVQKWHDMGFNVRAWGAKDFALMKHAYDCGVDGMTVNFPDQLIRYMVEKQ